MRRRSLQIGDWRPKQHECHQNADYVHRHFPQLSSVRGWLISSENEFGQCLLDAHSAIEDAGTLYDITLADQNACEGIRFIRHLGTDKEFFAVARHWVQRVYPPSQPEAMDGSGEIEDHLSDEY